MVCREGSGEWCVRKGYPVFYTSIQDQDFKTQSTSVSSCVIKSGDTEVLMVAQPFYTCELTSEFYTCCSRVKTISE